MLHVTTVLEERQPLITPGAQKRKKVLQGSMSYLGGGGFHILYFIFKAAYLSS